jgi:hypothetical protein
MPGLIANYQKQQTITQLKKIYAVLNQSYLSSQADNGESSGWAAPSDMGIETYFEQYWKPYLKINKECDSLQSCGYKAGNNYPWKGLNGAQAWAFIDGTRKIFMLPDGVLVQIVVTRGTSVGTPNGDWINVDLNGGKAPNIYGKDVFCFEGDRAKGALVPLSDLPGFNGVCQKSGYGLYCAAKIMEDGWEIKEDYPW